MFGVEMCPVMSLATEMGRDEEQFPLKQVFPQLTEMDANSAQRCLGISGHRVDFWSPNWRQNLYV